MTSDRARQFRIGVFVLSSLGILAAALFAFGVRRELERKQKFETYVPGNADGLAVGAAVKLKGVNVGEVTKISFSWIEYPGGDPPCVVVYFEAKESVNPAPGSTAALDDQVRRGLRAVITSQGITGASFLSLDMLDPVKNPPVAYSWTPRGYVIPSAESQLNHIIAAVERTLTKLDRVDVDRLAARLEHTLQSADATLGRLASLDAARLSQDLSDAAVSTRSAAAEFRALASEARGTMRGMQLDALSADADRLLVGLQDSNVRLQRLIDRLSGVDVRDLNETLAGTRQVARHLDDTIQELRKYPSGFLFGKEPPPARSVGREGR